MVAVLALREREDSLDMVVHKVRFDLPRQNDHHSSSEARSLDSRVLRPSRATF